MLSTKNQNAIKALARQRWINGKENPEFGTENKDLDALMEKIRKEEPLAFHNSATLRERVFINEPTQNIECKGFIYPFLRKSKV